MGDKRDIMPVQKDLNIIYQNNGKRTQVEYFKLMEGVNENNTYVLRFKRTHKTDALVMFFDKDILPKSEIPEQEGVVRIAELDLFGRAKDKL